MLFIGNVMRPTYIYIKQHLKTGLKYLGKTVKDPYNYLGSGKYWKSHIHKHGIQYVHTCLVHTDIHKQHLSIKMTGNTFGSKLTKDDVIWLRTQTYYYGFYQDMASKFGVNRRIIRKAYLGITWPNLND